MERGLQGAPSLLERGRWHDCPSFYMGDCLLSVSGFLLSLPLHPLEVHRSAFLIPVGKIAIWHPGGLLHDWSR